MFPDAADWGKHLIWGNQRANGGRLTPDANAWSSSVVWGDSANDAGQAVTWGVICADGTNCDVTGWSTGAALSQNVVWGSLCGGADCSTSTWSTSYDDDTVVWGNSGDDDDTVVWGNSGDDDDTVVWGNSGDDDTVVWGNNCSEPECQL